MLKVGLTGGIGSGKTVVSNIFRILGIPIFNADQAAKKMMAESPEVRELLIKEFGEETYTDERLNRPFLAAQVFSESYKLDRLNAITHPLIIDAANRWMRSQTAPYIIKEAALIFESGSGAHLDYIIGVFAPMHMRLKRAMDRDQVSEEAIRSRMKRQISDTIKMKLCDFILVNDEQKLLLPQVLALHKQLVKLSDGII